MKRKCSLEEKLAAIALVEQGMSARSVSDKLHLGPVPLSFSCHNKQNAHFARVFNDAVKLFKFRHRAILIYSFRILLF